MIRPRRTKPQINHIAEIGRSTTIWLINTFFTPLIAYSIPFKTATTMNTLARMSKDTTLALNFTEVRRHKVMDVAIRLIIRNNATTDGHINHNNTFIISASSKHEGPWHSDIQHTVASTPYNFFRNGHGTNRDGTVVSNRRYNNIRYLYFFFLSFPITCRHFGGHTWRFRWIAMHTTLIRSAIQKYWRKKAIAMHPVLNAGLFVAKITNQWNDSMKLITIRKMDKIRIRTSIYSMEPCSLRYRKMLSATVVASIRNDANEIPQHPIITNLWISVKLVRASLWKKKD